MDVVAAVGADQGGGGCGARRRCARRPSGRGRAGARSGAAIIGFTPRCRQGGGTCRGRSRGRRRCRGRRGRPTRRGGGTRSSSASSWVTSLRLPPVSVRRAGHRRRLREVVLAARGRDRRGWAGWRPFFAQVAGVSDAAHRADLRRAAGEQQLVQLPHAGLLPGASRRHAVIPAVAVPCGGAPSRSRCGARTALQHTPHQCDRGSKAAAPAARAPPIRHLPRLRADIPPELSDGCRRTSLPPNGSLH